ncbi:hypothetical protein GP486_003905 [Trichoglossum hirsutum]|uniref:Ankyrin repeat protein n=1 Tax=Trichoglossum hirsutum TaxID=265104 RepID=A0A9P8LCE0_9PEZI|nr:hypothetical protein GP486_003905 [Trichoglossum hirsutum]
MSSPAAVAPSKAKADGSGDRSRDADVGVDSVPALSLGDPRSSSAGLEDLSERGVNGDHGSVDIKGESGESEAETEKLYSGEPDGRRIKKEDQSDDERTTGRIIQMSVDPPNLDLRASASGLGKRKRTRQGNREGAAPEAGNSSSVLSSPGATTHSSKRDASESEESLSSPPQVHSKDSGGSSNAGSRKRKLRNGDSEDESRRRSSGTSIWQPNSGASVRNHESHSNQHHHNNNTKDRRMAHSSTATHGPQRTSADRSPSPHARSHRRTASLHSASQLPNGHGHKKQRKVPPPPVSTHESRYSDQVHSDSSSASISPHPFARTKKFPVDEMNVGAMASAKMPHKKHRDQIGRTHLARACASGDLKSVQLQLKERPEDKNLPDNAGNTPLQIASLEGHVNAVEALLQAGCDVDCRNNEKDTPLIDAIENSRLEVVRLLLRYGANPRLVNAKGFEPLDILDPDQENYHAIKHELERARCRTEARRPSEDQGGNNSAVQKESRQSSREISAASPAPKSPAAGSAPRRKNRREATRNDFLWLQPTKENLRDYAGRGDVAAVGHILSQRPEADTESLIAAARGGHDEVLQLLLGMGDGKSDPDPLKSQNYRQGQNTPMLAAIGRGNIKVVDLLLAQADFNPARRDYQGRTYFELAEDRRGDNWREERDLLKRAFDNHNREHGKGGDSSKSRSSPARTSRGAEGESRRHVRGEPSSSSATPQSHLNARRDPTRDAKREGVSRPIAPTKERSVEQSVPRRTQRLDAPREGSAATSDREPAILGPPKNYPQKPKVNDMDPASEDVAKPRRKLVSGKDLKDDQARRASVASTASSSSGKDKPLRRDSVTARDLPEPAKVRRDRKPDGIEYDKSSVKVVKTSGTDSTQNRGKIFSGKDRPQKRDHSGDRAGVIRREGSHKRMRSISPPRSRSRDSEFRSHGEQSHLKRRRVDSDGGKLDEKRAVEGSSASHADSKEPFSKVTGVIKDQPADHRSARIGRNSDLQNPQGRSLDVGQDTARSHSSGERRRLSSNRSDVHAEPIKKLKVDHRVRERIDDDKAGRDKADEPSKKRRPSLNTPMPSPRIAEERDRAAREKKECEEKARKARAEDELKKKQEEMEAIKKANDEAEALRKAQEEAALKQAKERKAKEEEEARRKAKEEEERRKAREEEEARRRAREEEAARKRAEEEAEALRKAKEEEKRKELLRVELLRQKTLRDELAHIQARAQQESHIDRKHVEGERERQLHAARVAEKKRREEEAERLRIELERKRQEEAERRRCEALPQALCDAARMDPAQARSAEHIKRWLPLFYAELPPLDEDGKPQFGNQNREKWILNVQAAPVLGLRDLDLSQYTAWTKRSAVTAERIRAWEVLGLEVTGRAPRDADPWETQRYHTVGQAKFFAIANIFWIKLSDFLDIVPRYPHLQGIRMSTVRIAFGSEEDYVIEPDIAEYYGVLPTTHHPALIDSENPPGQALIPQVNGYISPGFNSTLHFPPRNS